MYDEARKSVFEKYPQMALEEAINDLRNLATCLRDLGVAETESNGNAEVRGEGLIGLGNAMLQRGEAAQHHLEALLRARPASKVEG